MEQFERACAPASHHVLYIHEFVNPPNSAPNSSAATGFGKYASGRQFIRALAGASQTNSGEMMFFEKSCHAIVFWEGIEESMMRQHRILARISTVAKRAYEPVVRRVTARRILP